MKDLTGTKTLDNLKAAFSGESEARNKYTYFASTAKKEGYVQIAKFFEETAANEKEHAEIWFKLMNGIGTTKENLLAGASGELYEHSEMYPIMAKEAREEGFEAIAVLFEGVAAIEKEHEARYRALLKNIEDNKVFEKDEEITWICSNCGHKHTGISAPTVCPVCAHAQGYFQMDCKNY